LNESDGSLFRLTKRRDAAPTAARNRIGGGHSPTML
jgi:hypothetical protein